MSATVRSKQSYTSQNTDQTIASIVAGDTVVYLGAVSDGDNVHRGIDSAPTVGGVSMTAAPGLITTGGQNNQVDIYILKNISAGTNVTFHTSYHATSPGYLGAIYVIQNADTTTQPQASTSDGTFSGTTPSLSLTGLSVNDLILEIICSSATPSVNSSQTSDYTGTGNGSSFAVSEKAASAGTNSESWTQSSAAYAYAGVAVKGTGGGGAPAAVPALVFAGD